jgi:hypothetical protein
MLAMLESELVKRNDVQVKVDAIVATQAKMVAASRGITVAEYVSELLRPLVLRDLEAETVRRLNPDASQTEGRRRRTDPGRRPRKPKGG